MKGLPRWLPVALILTLIGLVILYTALLPVGQEVRAAISWTVFRELVVEGRVQRLELRGQAAAGTLHEPRVLVAGGQASNLFRTRIPDVGDPDLLADLEAADVEVWVGEPEAEGNFFLALLPWLLIFGLYWWFWTRLRSGIPGGFGGRGDADKFLEGSARGETKAGPKVTFADVAGQDNAKREVAELVDFLRSPDDYTRLGAEIPHGVLLMGPPGTGKTLLARALAGEANVAFFHISASEFIEMFVGVGASRVRRMFDEAKKRAPSIIFIDELDSIGRVRGAGLGGGHDEREQTLNQILAEMDGFAGHEAVIVLAATNRPDVLDPALLRPGRFDRHVTLDLPDREAREAILRVHLKKVPIAEDVDVGLVAAGTPGFSGADLKNLVNEAAMLAARLKLAAVEASHFDEMRDRILMGSVRTLAIQPEERRRLAIHESGHTIVAHYLPNADPLHKVTIIPRGRALGATQQLPEKDRHTLPEAYLQDRLAVTLGGRAAERLLLDSISSGADDDIRQATDLARAMVGRWGMSETVGPVDVRESESHPFLGREIAQPRRFSEATAEAVDHAVRTMLGEAEDVATSVIGDHRERMDRLVRTLEEEESLDHGQIGEILGPPRNEKAAAPKSAGPGI